MEKYLKIAARAWANATLNIQKFADAYVYAINDFGAEAAQEEFSSAYPMFGGREWKRLWLIGTGELLPQFFFKSDYFVGRLLKLNSSMRIQKALVGASNDGRIRVDRGNGPEKVKIADLTRNEEKALILLLSEENEKLSPSELKLKYRTLVAKVNKSGSGSAVKWYIAKSKGRPVVHVSRACNMDAGDIEKIYRCLHGKSSIGCEGRIASDILSDLVDAVLKLNSLRDDEWDFEEAHGSRDMWDEDIDKEHEKLIDEIQAARDLATRLIREATGDYGLEV